MPHANAHGQHDPHAQDNLPALERRLKHGTINLTAELLKIEEKPSLHTKDGDLLGIPCQWTGSRVDAHADARPTHTHSHPSAGCPEQCVHVRLQPRSNSSPPPHPHRTPQSSGSNRSTPLHPCGFQSQAAVPAPRPWLACPSQPPVTSSPRVASCPTQAEQAHIIAGRQHSLYCLPPVTSSSCVISCSTKANDVYIPILASNTCCLGCCLAEAKEANSYIRGSLRCWYVTTSRQHAAAMFQLGAIDQPKVVKLYCILVEHGRHTNELCNEHPGTRPYQMADTHQDIGAKAECGSTDDMAKATNGSP